MIDRRNNSDIEQHNQKKKWFFNIGAAALALVVLFSLTSRGQGFWENLFEQTGLQPGSTTASHPSLNIHFLDVGKADAILLDCEGHAAVLDAGTAADGDKVVDYLARCGIEKLDYAIMSHPDKDHIGGMAQVLREVPVDAFVRAKLAEGLVPDSVEYWNMARQLEESSIRQMALSPGNTFSLGEAEITVLGPVEQYEDTNNASLVFKLVYGSFSALFCGDIEKEGEKGLTASRQDLSADLLKVPHHGSKTSCTKRFLKEVAPKYAVISTGIDNNDLPREEILHRLEEVNADIYRTDTDGTIIFSIDGTDISIKTEK